MPEQRQTPTDPSPSVRLARGESRPLSDVASELGFAQEFVSRVPVETIEVRSALDWLANERPSGQNHWPALTLAFVAQVERLASLEQVDRFEDIFESNPPERARAAGRAINTLNFTSDHGDSTKLRPLYNKALQIIRHTMLRAHPSNPGHATQSWPAYRPLVTAIAAMTPAERRSFADEVWELGVLDQPTRSLARVTERTARPFELVLKDMPTSVPRVRGGAILQGLSFGYLRADSPNLILESHNVNTGSSRAGMLGDVDGFRGREPELAAEVKDLELTGANVEVQLGDFLEDIVEAPNVTAIVFCVSASDEARDFIESRGVTVLDKNDLARRVAVWDVPKQHEALRGAEYYLGRIQKDDNAVDYLRDWLAGRGVDGVLGVAASPGDDLPSSQHAS